MRDALRVRGVTPSTGSNGWFLPFAGTFADGSLAPTAAIHATAVEPPGPPDLRRWA